MWELDYKESWAPKNWCFWTVVSEKILDSPLYCKEIKPVNPKGNQPWMFFIGRTDAEAEAPILWLPVVKNWLIWKDPDAGKDWGQGEKGMTEGEMVGWHHELNGHGFGWTPNPEFPHCRQILYQLELPGKPKNTWVGSLSLLQQIFFALNILIHACMLSCVRLSNSKDHSLPGFFVHGNSQVRILEWVAISFSRESS